ncbi:MAG: cupin domain-containing protein [Thermodesulfobacteriota bacterium]
MGSIKKSVAVAGSVYKYLATGEDTGGAYSLFEALVPPKDPGPPPHIHRNEDEAFYVLKGRFTIFSGDEEFRAEPGDFISLPRGISHSFRSDSDEAGRLLVIVSPSGFEKFFDAVGEPVTDDTKFPPPPSEEHIRKIIEEAPKFGIQLIL